MAAGGNAHRMAQLRMLQLVIDDAKTVSNEVREKPKLDGPED